MEITDTMKGSRASNLAAVRRAAERHRLARLRLEETMRAARSGGASLRALAQASGFSIEHVRTMTKGEVSDA